VVYCTRIICHFFTNFFYLFIYKKYIQIFKLNWMIDPNFRIREKSFTHLWIFFPTCFHFQLALVLNFTISEWFHFAISFIQLPLFTLAFQLQFLKKFTHTWVKCRFVVACFYAKINVSQPSDVMVGGSYCTLNSQTLCAPLQHFWLLDVCYLYWSRFGKECIFRMECHGRVPVWSQYSRLGALSKAFWELKLSGKSLKLNW